MQLDVIRVAGFEYMRWQEMFGIASGFSGSGLWSVFIFVLLLLTSFFSSTLRNADCMPVSSFCFSGQIAASMLCVKVIDCTRSVYVCISGKMV